MFDFDENLVMTLIFYLGFSYVLYMHKHPIMFDKEGNFKCFGLQISKSQNKHLAMPVKASRTRKLILFLYTFPQLLGICYCIAATRLDDLCPESGGRRHGFGLVRPLCDKTAVILPGTGVIVVASGIVCSTRVFLCAESNLFWTHLHSIISKI